VGRGAASMHNRHILYMARVLLLLLLLSYLRCSLIHLHTHTHTHKHAQAPYSAHLTRSHSFSFARSLALALSLSLRSVGAVGSLSTLTLALPPAVFIISCLAVPCASSSQSQLAADDVSPLRQ